MQIIKKILKANIYILLVLIFFLPIVFVNLNGIEVSFAQESAPVQSTSPLGYQPLAPSVVGENPSELSLAGYLNRMFFLFLGVASILSVVMIVYAGVTWAFTVSDTGKSAAKKQLENAIWGLLLALGSWLILATINPKLLDFNLTLESVDIPEAPAPEIPPISGQELAVRNAIFESGIGINNPPCPAGQTRGCTNVAGLPGTAVARLQNLLRDMEQTMGINIRKCSQTNQNNCDLVITGGTEGGHATHGPGIPIVDLRTTAPLNNYITQNNTCSEQSPLGMLYKVDGSTFVRESTPPHWHVCLGQSCSFRNWQQSC